MPAITPSQIKTLRKLERAWLAEYPGGFDNADIVAIGKRHPVGKMSVAVQDDFRKTAFHAPDAIARAFVATLNKSSMIARFDKPKVRAAVNAMDAFTRERLAANLYALLHETDNENDETNKARAFGDLVALLAEYKLARWSIATLIPYTYHRDAEVFVKPTTTKAVLATFAPDEQQATLIYQAKPTWAFYTAYRRFLLDLKAASHLAVPDDDNAAFTGFLMMALQQ